MESVVVSREGDTVDEIAWRHYGADGLTDAVYDANRGLASHGPILPAGVEIRLPDHAALSAPESAAPSLWE